MNQLFQADWVWNKLKADGIAFERTMDRAHRKQTGCYFTALDLCYAMMDELVRSLPLAMQRTLFEKSFFEPCVGTGNFVFAYLAVCRKMHFSAQQYRQLIENIFVCDSNPDALALYMQNLKLVAQEWFAVPIEDGYFGTHVGSALIFDMDSPTARYIPLREALKSAPMCGFDIVATNPPYKSLKAEHVHYPNTARKEADRQKYAAVAKLAAEHFEYSTSGTLNLSRFFVEEIVERYLAPGGYCTLLLPSSILSDKSCAKLRTRLLGCSAIRSLRLIAENSGFVDSAQAVCTMLLKKGRPTKKILVDGAFSGDIQQGSHAMIDDILDDSTQNAILVLCEGEYQTRSAMRKHPTIKEIPYILNLRGELDLTLNKAAITTEKTPYRLLRGRNIDHYKAIIELPDAEYVSEWFVQSTAKKRHVFAPRLACQQIANMAKKRRVAFSLIPPMHVLANSCNFIALEPNQDGVDMFFLMGILNSDLVDWYFKLTSSNNHISNYEIGNFPVPVCYPRKSELSALVQQHLASPAAGTLARINAMVREAYGIKEDMAAALPQDAKGAAQATAFDGPEAATQAFCRDLGCIFPGVTLPECSAILHQSSPILEACLKIRPGVTQLEEMVLKGLEKKYRALYGGFVLNHTTFKLSELDLEMIAPIPQGGNWKDIPPETVKKSKRLQQIAKTGGRTTLYGRMDYAKPAYTITTYFNRPGNGTYVHPVHNRVLSVREAARLQSFPDDYMFFGNKAEILQQVGNAVPVLLAYALASNIRARAGCSTSVDLFSGAGGMTCGFELAGIGAAIANDILLSACTTLKVNNPKIPVLCGDIAQESTKRAIIKAGKAAGADIICGGPPCQGFSLAGHRMENDPRNQLFYHFADIIGGVLPKVIVFENVEGLLSFQGGATYRSIIELFSGLGYHAEARKLLASDFGVPQRRKRVIILCTRKDSGVLPADLFPPPVTPSEKMQTTAYDAISDLEQVECSERARYGNCPASPYLQYLKRQISAGQLLAGTADTT